MIKKVLIANRGEIGLRILRACKALDIKTVAVYSEVDRDLMHVRLADESVCIGSNPSSESYLNIPRLISACEITGADAVHPGYGFLAENAGFCEQLERSGFIFVGPSADTIRQMGDKVSAIQMAKSLGLPTVPGSGGPLPEDIQKIHAIADGVGYPIIIKAAAGGGGKGMRVVNTARELENAVQLTRNEAEAAFGSGVVYLEKFLTHPRHIEVQVLGDGRGHAVHLGNRDCSMQRRHQKVLEEGMAPDLPEQAVADILDCCVRASRQMSYRGAGTFEFLYEAGCFYFIEMNTRIQVEHPVTEMITGVDLVTQQLLIAATGQLALQQEHISFNGHAIECRINAEDSESFMPSPGKVTHFHAPGGIGVRTDSHLYNGYQVPPFYDSMIAKIITHAHSRAEAIRRMQIALDEVCIEGIQTNIALQQKILADQGFQKGGSNIHYLEQHLLRDPMLQDHAL